MDWKENIRLDEYTTFKVGGRARFFVTVTYKEQLIEIFNDPRIKKYPWYTLGGGSNLLVNDNLQDCIVIHVNLKGREAHKRGEVVHIGAKAGENWDDIVSWSVQQGWSGLELLSYIPGTVGAAPIQNIGAYGQEVSSVIGEVEAFDPETQAFVVLTNKECNFAYRTSCFKNIHKNYIVTEVRMKLKENWERPSTWYPDLQRYESQVGHLYSVKQVREAIIAIRTAKLPNWKEIGTAGSYFKNPIIKKNIFQSLKEQFPELPGYQINEEEYKIPAAWLIDKGAGLKGYTEGKVGTYKDQALVLVNYGGAQAEDIKKLADKIIKNVYERTGVVLEPEVVEWK